MARRWDKGIALESKQGSDSRSLWRFCQVKRAVTLVSLSFFGVVGN